MELQNFKPLNQGSIVAEFDVYIPEWKLTMCKLKLIRSMKGHLFACAPSFKTSVNGAEKAEFKSYWEFERETGSRFFNKALELAKQALEKNPVGVANNDINNSAKIADDMMGFF